MAVTFTTFNAETVPDVCDFRRYSLFNVWVNVLTLEDIRDLLVLNIGQGRKFILANQNLHGMYVCAQDEKARQFFEQADFIHIDGTSIVVLGRLAGLPFQLKHRCGYMDLFPFLLPTIVENGWRVFYLGAKSAILEEGLRRLRDQYPGLQIDGYHGYFSQGPGDSECDEAVKRINDFHPHILLVGMGMPIQEHWTLVNYPRLDVNAVLHCGGMIDYIAGDIPTPPRWLGPIGLEWVFRLFSEPRRLWKRYLLEPVALLFILLFRRRRRTGLGQSANLD